jgi:cytosine/adenosine deaminase-related metal-dependent hydrolase
MLLAHGRFVLSDPDAVPGEGLLEHGAVVAEGDRIVAVGQHEALRARYPEAAELGSDDHVVVPGLVNSHQHGQGLTTIQLGLLDDYLEPWGAAFWGRCHPLDAYLDTLYAAARMIKAGVTTAVHFGYSRGLGGVTPETRAALRAYEEAGIRVAFAIEVADRATFVYDNDETFLASLPKTLADSARALVADAVRSGADDAFDALATLRQEYGDHPAVRFLLAPAGPQWCSDDLLRRVADAARSLEVGIQAHCLESAYQRMVARDFYGCLTIEHLERMGILGEGTSLAHAVWLSDPEIGICADTGTSIAHNPSSNLRLRVGISPVNRMLDRGVAVGIGTDGMALADDEGMLEEVRLAARLRGLPFGSRDAPPPSSRDAIRMATVNGARVSGFDGCGRLVEGGPADLILLDWRRIGGPFLDRTVDVLDALVYRARSSDVVSVVAQGRLLLDEGHLVTIDEDSVARQLAELASSEAPAGARQAMSVRRSLEPHVEAFFEGWAPATRTPSYEVNSLEDEPAED